MLFFLVQIEKQLKFVYRIKMIIVIPYQKFINIFQNEHF